MFIKSLKIIAQGLYYYVLPLSFTTIIFFQWSQLQPFEIRIMMSCAVLLFVRLENCFTPYSLFLQKSSFEYEITILLATVKIVNSLQTIDPQSKPPLLYMTILTWFFNIFLFINVISYILVFLIIISFALVVLVGLVRGDLEFINIRRGLSQDELDRLVRVPWKETKMIVHSPQILQNPHQIQQPEQIMSPEMELAQSRNRSVSENRSRKIDEDLCPICLMKFEDEAIVISLPKCKHIFHDNCIDEWLLVQPICPFCRNNVRIAQMNL